jgi:hypothetical protein
MGHVVLSGTYQCVVEADDLFLTFVTWVFGIVREVITLSCSLGCCKTLP